MYCGVTSNTPVIGDVVPLVALKEMSPDPLPDTPIVVFVFVQLYTVFAMVVVDPKSTFTALLAHTV